MTPERFPLSWPPGYPVTEYRDYSKFDCTLVQARDGIFAQLNRLGATEWLISTNAKPNKNDLLTDGRLIYGNPGVAVYFKYKGEQKVIACDKWRLLHENLRACEKSLEAIRGLDRWGCTNIISQAVEGMKALPENAGESNGTWWQILGVFENSSWPVIESQYKSFIKMYHPDNPRTGNRERFDLVQQAFQEAKKARL